MKTAKMLSLAMIIVLILSISAVAADLNKISADKTTKGDWVGNYGSDGYFLFANSLEGCVSNLPAYVAEFSYTTILGDDVSYHQWWTGTADDVSGIVESNAFEDAIWTDETKTSRYIPAIYNGAGLSVTIDVGSANTTVSIYACDWGDDGRCVTVTLYDGNGNTLNTYDLTEFAHGTYITADVTGKVVFEFAYYDATNYDGASNAVISAVFFDNIPAAVETTVIPEVAETEVIQEPAPETVTAPQTADNFVMAMAAVAVAFTVFAIVAKFKLADND
ncbi:MAG: hypothetical protein ACYCWE_15130 [Eubacteriales bacterium]